MKRFIFLVLLVVSTTLYAQETYQVDGKSYTLKTEESGELTLLWNIIDDNYRYFIKSENGIVELVNTKGEGRKYNEEYKTTLSNLTNNYGNIEKVKLTLTSLKKYIHNYNNSRQPEDTTGLKNNKLGSKLLFFGGITNHPFVDNPKNAKNLQFGFELEVFQQSEMPRHSLFLSLNHSPKSDDFELNNTQFNLGYRYRVINKEAFNIYGSLTLATMNISTQSLEYYNEDNLITEDDTSSDFNVPFSFGIGTDIKISKNGYITLMYNELFALFLDSHDNFSTNISLGYKLNL